MNPSGKCPRIIKFLSKNPGIAMDWLKDIVCWYKQSRLKAYMGRTVISQHACGLALGLRQRRQVYTQEGRLEHDSGTRK